jgi:hypothetical protein
VSKKFFIFSFLIITFAAHAQVSFTVSAPPTVVMDEPFQITYNLNAIGEDFHAPDFKDFELLAKPFSYVSAAEQSVNGKKVASSRNMTYTITLQSKKTGTFSIGTASVLVDGKKYVSKGISIKVLAADTKPKQQQSEKPTESSSISSKTIFVKAQLSKTQVFEQEGVLLTYKLYTTLDVVKCYPIKTPDFQGFMKQDVEIPRDRQFVWEKVNGKNYVSIPLAQVILFPQQSGPLSIPSAEFESIIQMQQGSAPQSPFDDYFGDPSIVNVKRIITASAVTVEVNSLPVEGKPASFSGAAGQFSLNSSISSNQVKANDAVTLQIVISGEGNMKMVKNPDIKFPEGFEVYDPKSTNDFNVSASGISGTKTIEYLFIPRNQGEYEIPAAEFSYFDTNTKGYKTITTPVYKLHVEKGDVQGNAVITGGNYANKEDIKKLGNDIRYINTDEDIQLVKDENLLFGTLSAWLMYVIPLFLALILFVIFRKKAKENSDIRLVKNKRANKVAKKRLKQAQRLLMEGKKDQFYEEVLKSIWNYLNDKLGISAAELTKEKINNTLTEKGVENAQIQKLNDILNTCEFARYAPNTGQTEMGNLYDDTADLIEKLEEKL